MKTKRFLSMLCASALVLAVTIPLARAASKETKYEAATDGTAEVVFGPNANAQLSVVGGTVTADYAGTIKAYEYTGTGRQTWTSTNNMPAASWTVGLIPNSTFGFTNSDKVVFYDTSADMAYYRTISSVTATSVTLSAAITPAGGVGDYLYEMSQMGQVPIVGPILTIHSVLTNGVPVQGNLYDLDFTEEIPADLFVVDAGSPLYIVASTVGGGTSNVTLNVTAKRE